MPLVRRRYPLRMKAGTAGTIDDPHRPDVVDILGKLPPGTSWRVDQAKGEIEIVCDVGKHDEIAAVRRAVG